MHNSSLPASPNAELALLTPPPAPTTRRSRTAALLAGLALAGVASVPSAQVLDKHYATNWQPLLGGVNTAFSGQSLFSPSGGGSLGGAIRRCYGIDATQGGRNQSEGQLANTWYRVAQGYGSSSAVPGVNIGLVSIQVATSSDVGADPCISPFAADPGSTGGHKVLAAAFLGTFPGTVGTAFPATWEVAFQWVGTSVSGPTTLGVDGAGHPLLVNLIYEVQGPTNSAGNQYYYLASTTESTGAASGGPTGGVTNGNSRWGTSAYGVPPDISGAVSHSRVFTGNGTAYAPSSLQAGDTEIAVGFLAFHTPALWASNDGNWGAGGADWRVGSAPVSKIQLRMLDVLAGGQGHANLTGTPSAPGAAAYDPGIDINRAWFLWSATSADTMQQKPMSWDDLGGVLAPQAGSIRLGPQATLRRGPQTVPVTFDALTLAILPVSALSLGSTFTDAADPVLDSVPGATGINLFEGLYDPITSGISQLEGGARPLVGGPSPSLVGMRLGIAAVGIQRNLSYGPGLSMTEFANGLTVNLMP